MEKRFPPEGSLRDRYGQDLAVDSFKLRRIIGDDELAAAERAEDAPGIVLEEQMICEAIVEVDDKPVQRPYQGFRGWDSVTRDFVRAAFRRLCNAKAGDLADFLKEAFGDAGPAPSSSEASTANSPGSPGTSKEGSR
jgi:hypothetical protein